MSSFITGAILVLIGFIIGFLVEWLLDVGYRRIRELQRQLDARGERAYGVDEGEDITITHITGESGEDRVAIHEISRLVRERDEELRQLRLKLDETEAKMEELRDEFDDYVKTHPDDLTDIKGVGRIYQWKLRDLGFSSYKQLANADPAELRRMLGIKEWQRTNVEAWIEQARDLAKREKRDEESA